VGARHRADHRIVTWDFSLTEGEGAIVPHYRFDRLYAQRHRELEAAPYQGGICFTMTPLLNQLSLYQSAQSFLNPDADHKALTRAFYRRLFGADAERLAGLLPLFEIIPDWGNYAPVNMSRTEYHHRMAEGVDLLRSLEGKANLDIPFNPARRSIGRSCSISSNCSRTSADHPPILMP